MDGIIEPILRRLQALESHVWGPPADDSGHDVFAQTLHPARMPATPGLPIAPYDPSIHQDDETDAAIAAERGDTSFIPSSDDGDPTLNADGSTKSRRRKVSEPDPLDAA